MKAEIHHGVYNSSPAEWASPEVEVLKRVADPRRAGQPDVHTPRW